MSETWKTPYSKPLIIAFWSTVGGLGVALILTIVTGIHESRTRAALITTPVALPADSNSSATGTVAPLPDGSSAGNADSNARGIAVPATSH